MMRIVVLALTLLALSPLAMAEELTGYIADATCAKSQGPYAAAEKHASCALKCLHSGGAEAVLLTEEGRVYKIENQDKVMDHVGHKVTLTGKIDDDKIVVDSVKM